MKGASSSDVKVIQSDKSQDATAAALQRTRSPVASPELQRDRVQSDSTGPLLASRLRGSLAPSGEGGEEVRRAAGSVSSPVLASTVRNRLTLVQGTMSMTTSKSDMSDMAKGETPLQKLYKQRRMYSLARQHLTVKGDGQTMPAIGAIGENGLPVDLPAQGRVQALRWAMQAVRSSARRVIMEKKLVGTFQSLISEKQAKQLLSEVRNMLVDCMQEFVLDRDLNKLGDSMDAIKEEVAVIATEHGHHSVLVKFTDVVDRALGRLKRQELAAQTYQNAREVLEAFKLDLTSDEDLVCADEAELVRQELLNAMAIIDDFERNATELRRMIEVLGSSDRDIDELDVDVHHVSQASGSSRASPAAHSDHPAVSDTAAGDDGSGQQVSSGLHTPPVVPGSPPRDLSVEKKDAGPQSSDAAGREEACVEADQGTVSEKLAVQANVGVDRVRQMRGDFVEMPKAAWEPIAQGIREELVAAGNGGEVAAQFVQALQQSAWKDQVHAAIDALVRSSSWEESMLKACIENSEGELQEVVRRSQLFAAAHQIAIESAAGVEEDGEASAGSDESALLPPQEGGNADSPDPLALLEDRLEGIVQAQALAPAPAACGGGGSQTPSERRGRPDSNAAVRSASRSLVPLGKGSKEHVREGPEAEKEEAGSPVALKTPQHRHHAGTDAVGEQAAAGDFQAHSGDGGSTAEVAAHRTRGSRGPAAWLAGSSPATSGRSEVSRKIIVNNFALERLDEETREKLEHMVSQVYADELGVGASQVTTVGKSLNNDTELEVKVTLSEGRSAFALKIQMQRCSGQLDSKVVETMSSLAGASRDKNDGGLGIVAVGAFTVVTAPGSGWTFPMPGQSPLATAQPMPLRAVAVASPASARSPQSPAVSQPWEDRKTTLMLEGPPSPQSSRSPEGRSRAHGSFDASSPHRRKSLLEDDRFGRWFPEQLERSGVPTWSRGADVLIARYKASREPSPRDASKEGTPSQEKPLSLAGGPLSKSSSTASPPGRSPRPSSKAKANARAVAKHDSTPGALGSKAAQAVLSSLKSPELQPLAGPGPPRQRPRASSLANPWWTATGSPSAPSASRFSLGGPAAAPGSRTRAALWDLRKRVVLQWGDVEAAARALCSCGGKVGGSTRISVATLHSQLQQGGFVPGCSELCVLFQALGLPCTETATLSQGELMRLESFESQVAELTDAKLERFDSLLGDLELRRMLVKGIDVPGQLISQVYLSVTRAEGAKRTDADLSTADAALADALKRCAEALEGEGAAALASAVVSKTGLPVLVAAMVSASVTNEARRAAASVVSAALDHATGLDSHTEALLVAELWLPLLRFFEWEEPEASPPVHRREQLDAATLEALLSVLRVARVPGMVAGQSGTAVAPQVASLLQRMTGRQLELHGFVQVLKASDVLVEGHVALDLPSGGGSADEVHTMCAAFGGCSLLREQLASLAIKDKLSSMKAFGGKKEAEGEGEGEVGPSPKTARIRGEALLQSWEAARQRLLARWQGPSASTSHSRHTGLWKLEALSKVDSRAHAEGFELSWEEQPSQSQSQPPQSLEEPAIVEPSSSLMQSWLPGTVEYEIVLRLLARDRIRAGTTCSPPRKLPPDPSARALGPAARARKKLRPLGAQSARGAAESGAQLPWSVSGPPGSARLSRNLDGPGATALSAAVRRGELSARRGLYRPLPGLGQSSSAS